MATKETYEMMCAFAAGAMDRNNYIQFKEYVQSGKEMPNNELGELQNIMALIPIILELEEPRAKLKDDVAKRLLSYQKEIKEKLSKDKKISFLTTSDETKIPDTKIEQAPVDEPLKFKKTIETDEISRPIDEEPETEYPGNIPVAEQPPVEMPVFSENDFYFSEPDPAESVKAGLDNEIITPEQPDLEIDLMEEIKQQYGLDNPFDEDKSASATVPQKSIDELEPVNKNEKPATSVKEPVESAEPDLPVKSPAEKQLRTTSTPKITQLQFSEKEALKKSQEFINKARLRKLTGSSIFSQSEVSIFDSKSTKTDIQENRKSPEISLDDRPKSGLKRTDVPAKRKIHDYQPQETGGFQKSFKGKSGGSGKGVSKTFMVILFIILLAVIAGGVYLYRENMNLKNDLANTKLGIADSERELNNYKMMNEFLQYKDIMISNLAGSDIAQNASGNLFISPVAKSALLQIKNMPSPETGREYQVWIIIRGQSQPLGVLRDGLKGEYFQTFDYSFETTETIDLVRITSEPEGGSSSPTGKTFLYGAVR